MIYANGQEWLQGLKVNDPKTFCMLLAKLIPHELKLEAADDGVPLLILRDYTGGKGGQVVAERPT